MPKIAVHEHQAARVRDRAGHRRYSPDLGWTKRTMTVDGTHASAVTFTGGNVEAQATAGTKEGFSNLRDVFVREDVVRENFHARATFDPPFYGDRGDGTLILPQHGIVLRYQRDSVQRAVLVWHNIFFVVPFLLVGVWQADLDGTNFTNRQADGFPDPALSFPFNVECRLRDTIVDVRQWEVGDPVPSWDDSVLARSIDLDVDAGDAGAIPTPVGVGSPGLAAAHLGTDDLSMVRYPLDAFWETPDSYATAVSERGFRVRARED